jgi:hypothetical protein
LHVLCTPPAFVLSQDQTLRINEAHSCEPSFKTVVLPTTLRLLRLRVPRGWCLRDRYIFYRITVALSRDFFGFPSEPYGPSGSSALALRSKAKINPGPPSRVGHLGSWPSRPALLAGKPTPLTRDTACLLSNVPRGFAAHRRIYQGLKGLSRVFRHEFQRVLSCAIRTPRPAAAVTHEIYRTTPRGRVRRQRRAPTPADPRHRIRSWLLEPAATRCPCTALTAYARLFLFPVWARGVAA